MNPPTALAFWEHPDKLQLMELICLGCGEVHYLGRKKHQPYPFMVTCPTCKSVALPTQEKKDWLKTLEKPKNVSA